MPQNTRIRKELVAQTRGALDPREIGQAGGGPRVARWTSPPLASGRDIPQCKRRDAFLFSKGSQHPLPSGGTDLTAEGEDSPGPDLPLSQCP